MEHLMWKYNDVDWDAIREEAVHKILACDPAKNHLAEIFVAENFPHLTTVSSEKNLVDIFDAAADKYHCIKKVMTDRNIDPDQMLFFGDNNNDRLALLEIPHSVCVGTAVPALAAAARYQTPSAAEDGVLVFLEKHFP